MSVNTYYLLNKKYCSSTKALMLLMGDRKGNVKVLPQKLYSLLSGAGLT